MRYHIIDKKEKQNNNQLELEETRGLGTKISARAQGHQLNTVHAKTMIYSTITRNSDSLDEDKISLFYCVLNVKCN